MKKFTVCSLIRDKSLSFKFERLVEIFDCPISHSKIQNISEIKEDLANIDLFVFYEHDVSKEEFINLVYEKRIPVLIFTHNLNNSHFRSIFKDSPFDPFIEGPFSSFDIAAKMGDIFEMIVHSHKG
ncbi:hypothetical protein M899_2331 [Bacteriovorax sp. BSW11_IV]|uniref:hypothetical protein n=1 Tax=Bacteriovorax sp. BSW11_IV TaxID=1353529 RepID=UPI000389F0D2|nr:hypothetical protein [Bacteriovorax sp. BSW11_IV]EQC44585.1 hypothetical protein M899_2331 [Bacteriovorax sp. BSW11_IV]